jgi:hypothetical protein
MDSHLHYLVNAGICWFIVLMAAGGYFLTMKRMGQKWAFWLTLITGWGFLAITNSLTALGIGLGTNYLRGIWLSSYVLVSASLVLLFIKLIQMRAKVKGTIKEVRTK